MNLIAEKLFGRHEDFLRYCEEAGKQFVDELDREDFIAYRSEYSVAREEIEQIKILLNFQEQSPQKNISDELTDDSLGKFFNVDDLAPYENILVVELDFNLRVQNCLRRNGYKTLAELLKSSRQEISGLKNFGQGSLDNLFSTLKKFFTPRLPAPQCSWEPLLSRLLSLRCFRFWRLLLEASPASPRSSGQPRARRTSSRARSADA